MKKRSMHDMLTLMADMERANLHRDRLSRVIGDTLSAVDEMGELSDNALINVVAARKEENMEDWENPLDKKKK